jgi:ATP-dependent helicase/nuclease subunit A
VSVDLKQLTDANQAIASDPRLSAWVSANAGTGKTTVLVNRVLRLLLHKDETGKFTRSETILCLTYTKAAAGEMENRLFGILSSWAVMSEPELAGALKDLRGSPAAPSDMERARRLFATTLDTKGGLKIHTIHAFCERLLHRFPLEAGVQADFTVLEDSERRTLRDAAIDAVLTRASADLTTPLGDALQVVISATDEDRFREIIEVVLGHQEQLRAMHALGAEPEQFGENEALVLRQLLGAHEDINASNKLKKIANTLSDNDIRECLEVLSPSHTWEKRLIPKLQAALGLPDDFRASIFQSCFLTGKGKATTQLIGVDLKKNYPEIAERLESTRDRVLPLAVEYAALHIASSTGALLTLGDQIIGEYERRKAARAALDYDDLIDKTVRLLRSSHAAQWVLYKLDYGIDHILVDEAQDTSPVQWKVIDALANEFFTGEGARDTSRTMFAVGDEKQSIYSFQGADPASFAEQGQAFKKMAEGSGRPWERVPLTVSFRSTEPVLKSVDDVFAGELASGGVTWAGEPVVHQAVRAGQAGLVELWPIEEPEQPDQPHAMRPYDEMPTQAHTLDRLIERIANTIRNWLDNKEQLEARGRPIRPGDILILVRSRNEFVSKLIRALKKQNIPVAGADRMTLTEQLAVMDLVAVGDFVLLPDDDLNLATILKSPLIGFDDDDLFDLAYERPGALWNALRDKAGSNEKYAAAVEQLTTWLNRADTLPPYEFFAGLLEENQMEMRRALIARLGADAGDAIDEFLNMALDYERLAPPSLQGFLDWINKGEAQVKRDMEQGRDEVRIMTAHGAKGLEANIVFLPDSCKGASSGGGAKPKLLPVPRASAPPDTPGHLVWVPSGTMPLEVIEDAKNKLKEAEREEHNRLLYVAMTRARDRLYVCGWRGVNKPPKECWHNLVSAGLEGLASEVTDAFGETVLRYESPQTSDPQDRNAGVDGVPEAESLPEWGRNNAPVEEPATLSLTPSAISAATTETGVQLTEADVVPPLERGDPARFLRGNIIHALLEHLPGMPVNQRETRAHEFVAVRGRDLNEAERQAIISETMTILSHETFAPIFSPSSQAEVPIVARIKRDKGPAIELSGQIDRLVGLDDEILIVDYKTNRPPPKSPEAVAPLYRWQLAAYRVALSQVFPGKRIRTALLWTDVPDLMEMPDELLDEAAEILSSL